MCTALSYRQNGHYFGRTLDIERTYGEQVAVLPRRQTYSLKSGGAFTTRYALIGMAAMMGGRPMYYDAVNEKGLAMAGLNFPGNMVLHPVEPGKDNIAPFELFPWILGQAADLQEARALLERLNLVDLPLMEGVPGAELHYLISDRTGSLVVEPVAEGLKIYENPYDVITNNPPFDYHLWNLRNYHHLSPENQPNRFSAQYPLENYAVGMGAIGLPGDVSSASRFVRAAFHLTNSRCGETEEENVTQVFHIMDSVSMVRGCTLNGNGEEDITSYTACINVEEGIYYYKTYENNQITAIRMDQVDLDGSEVQLFPLRRSQEIHYEN